MVNLEEFEILLNKTENSILDFKSEFYDFSKKNNKLSTSKFVKDVISFCNTVRNESGFIVFGVDENAQGEDKLIGIIDKTDEAILQEKIKDKVFPRPTFEFYRIKYENKFFSILEFPVNHYETPISPIVRDLKGLEVGKVYYRKGSSNTEANAMEIIRISDWLRTLPKLSNSESLNQQISNYLVDLSNDNIPLSITISNLLAFSKTNGYIDLQKFCITEIQGVDPSVNEGYDYRLQKVHISWNKIDINPLSMFKPTANLVKNEMDENKEFFDFRVVLHYPIKSIEQSIKKFENDPESFYGIINTSTQDIFDDNDKNFPMYIYVFSDNFINLYSNIRQKAIDLLLNIN